jgi:DNA invertase Pin-like site-specific DNA recombinase
MSTYIAAYLRLSSDDETHGESCSITSQRQLIRDYITSSSDFAGIPVREFADDGYSGTNFDRPGIKQLLNAVRKGEVTCIVVKDLSRFGRKYLEVSKFIELLFPRLGVRFIAVNDHYDSNSHKGTTAGIDIPIRNMINAIYSRDVSKKAKGAKRTLARQGKFIHAFAPYGYQKDGADKYRIVIDQPAAEVVRRIFALTCEGQGPMQIAKTLNADGIPTPSAYKAAHGKKLFAQHITSSLWTHSAVTRLLRDEQYIGTFIAGKTEAGPLGSGKKISKPKDDRIKIPNNHPPIVTQEVWDAACVKRHNISGWHGKPDTGRILYKRVRCGYCGHVMKYQKKEGLYSCGTWKYTDEYACRREMYREHTIIEPIKAVIQAHMAVQTDGPKQKSIPARVDNESKRLQALKRQLYERYKSGRLEKTTYLSKYKAIEAGICAKPSQPLSEASPSAGPSAGLVNALVETVRVFSQNRIEIVFSYRDFFVFP